MIKRIWLGVFYLCGWLVSTCLCLSPQYHYVADAKTWSQAQTYCRERYTDLVTIQNREELNRIINTVSSAGYSSKVWIGLYSEVDWQWSDGYTGTGADYRNWAPNEPDFWAADEYCVMIANGKWINIHCLQNHNVICYNGTQPAPEYVFVNKLLSMLGAQTYCRKTFTDLATVTSSIENQKIQNIMPLQTQAWFGIFRIPKIFWSDQTSFSYSNFDLSANQLGSERVICSFISVSSGKWNFWSCKAVLPFVCYSVPPVRKRQVVKLRIYLDPILELNNPAVKEDLLKKFQDRLTEKGMRVTLNWREQSDGKVFHKIT